MWEIGFTLRDLEVLSSLHSLGETMSFAATLVDYENVARKSLL